MLFRKSLPVYCTSIFLILIFSAALSARGFSWDRYKSKPAEWFNSPEAAQIADNILAAQDQYGSWPKNINTSEPIPADTTEDLRGTFDNGATTGEMRYLAHMYNAAKDKRYKDSFIKALDLILKVQYPTGGWPQRYPTGNYYHKHITFNDGAMVRLMELLKDIYTSPDYGFIDTDRIHAAIKAYDKGIDCILKCQIRVNGKLTVWCAQHDEKDYSPRPARSYELVSLSGGESTGIIRLLTSVEPPTPEIIDAITSAVEWYKKSQINDVVISRVDGKFLAEKSPDSKPVWARFYDIETNRPFFCDRDGIKKFEYSEIDQERSTHYAWYGDWGEDVFGYYEKWSKKWAHLLLPEGTRILAIIGDSTVSEYPQDNPARGWGQYIQPYFNDSVRVFNLAKRGRSTKTFITQGLWQQTLYIKPDYVLIQFGHNDSHDPGRKESTDAETDYRDYLRRYIIDSRAIAAQPVLVTPMYRRKFDDSGNIDDNLLPYANAMKAVAKEMNVPLIDLNSASEKYYLQYGPDKAQELASKPGDQTHFNAKGAKAMAQIVMNQLPNALPAIKQYLTSTN